MILKNIIAIAAAATLLVGAAAARADDVYRPGEFLGLTLERAALSPRALGPASRFEPVAVEARTEATVEPRQTAAVARIAHAVRRPANGVARVKLARRHGNPLDAQAFDTRIQVWPCRSGGICNWQKSR